MKKQVYLWLACAALSVTDAQAQVALSKGQKWDISIEQSLRARRAAAANPSRSGATAADSLTVIIDCADAAAVADSLNRRGNKAKAVTPETVKAKIAAADVQWAGSLPQVKYISATRRMKSLMKTAREYSNADKVHTGEGLETPFTGKGVIVGVIDRGFQYDHIAFKDADRKTRVIGLWNHNAGQDPTTAISNGGDGITGAEGHATHVAGIAAGSRIAGNDYYGMAPEADIVMVPSTFQDDDILEEAAYIKKLAESAGKPWVINMSFGSQYGPHDGSTVYDRSMDKLSAPGGLLVAAMGNEGGTNIHATHTFASADEVKTLLMNNTYATGDGQAQCEQVVMDLWNASPSGRQELSVQPFVYDAVRGKKFYLDDAFWQDYVKGEINGLNNKEHYLATVDLGAAARKAGIVNLKNAYFGLELQGAPGTCFHAWAPMPDDGYGDFVKKLSTDVTPDDEYIVGEGAASIPSAIAVASYNGAPNFTSAVNGNTYSFSSVGVTQGLSAFSSRGPWLGDEPKPTVAAPGATIAAPINKYVDFDKNNDLQIVGAVSATTGASVPAYITANVSRSDFYGVKCGTSMASPAAAGIIALWLQANPALTYAQVVEILRKTSKHDLYTGQGEWNSRFGYGKINAYEGLKEALRMAETNGIGEMLNGPEPVTLQRESGLWRVLFNNNESYADISVHALSGETVLRRHIASPRRGDETAISLAGLTPGVYMVRITTTAADMTRKVMVR